MSGLRTAKGQDSLGLDDGLSALRTPLLLPLLPFSAILTGYVFGQSGREILTSDEKHDR